NFQWICPRMSLSFGGNFFKPDRPNSLVGSRSRAYGIQYLKLDVIHRRLSFRAVIFLSTGNFRSSFTQRLWKNLNISKVFLQCRLVENQYLVADQSSPSALCNFFHRVRTFLGRRCLDRSKVPRQIDRHQNIIKCSNNQEPYFPCCFWPCWPGTVKRMRKSPKVFQRNGNSQ